jgi:hypothetical protein
MSRAQKIGDPEIKMMDLVRQVSAKAPQSRDEAVTMLTALLLNEPTLLPQLVRLAAQLLWSNGGAQERRAILEGRPSPLGTGKPSTKTKRAVTAGVNRASLVSNPVLGWRFPFVEKRLDEITWAELAESRDRCVRSRDAFDSHVRVNETILALRPNRAKDTDLVIDGVKERTLVKAFENAVPARQEMPGLPPS